MRKIKPNLDKLQKIIALALANPMKLEEKIRKSRKLIKGKGFCISEVYSMSGRNGYETALIKGSKFYILDGKWSKNYKPLVPKGYKACKKFFDSKKEQYRNFWSN